MALKGQAIRPLAVQDKEKCPAPTGSRSLGFLTDFKRTEDKLVFVLQVVTAIEKHLGNVMDYIVLDGIFLMQHIFY